MRIENDNRLSDAELVAKVEQYREEHNFCSTEKACKELDEDVKVYYRAKVRIEEEIVKLNQEKIKKQEESDTKENEWLQLMFIVKRIWDAEEEEKEREEAQEDEEQDFET